MATPKASWGAWRNSPPSHGSVPMGCLQMFLKAQCLCLGLSFPNTGLHRGSSHDSRKTATDEGLLAKGPWHMFPATRLLLAQGTDQCWHSIWCLCLHPFISDLEMSPQLERNAISGLLLLWFQTSYLFPEL